MSKQRIRIGAKSLPILRHIHRHVELCNLRGPLERFHSAATDSCDGHFYREELDDLVRRRLLVVVRYGFDDSRGRDPLRDSDHRLCGVGWSVHATDKLASALWPDRIAA